MASTIWICLVAVSAFVWIGILLLPWRPWDTREVFHSITVPAGADLSDITVLIPARNEAAVIGKTLRSLEIQGEGISVVMVDDRSTDGTSEVAQAQAGQNLRIIPGEPLPPDWSGKLWALEQGSQHVGRPLTLLIDADIELQPGIVWALRQKMKEDNLHLISLIAQMRMVSFWERWLMPAFVYFFKMLYPFRLSNSRLQGVAAAAGGCILLESELIREIGGFRVIRGELIDDCALARRIKSRGYRTWIGLTHSVQSQRSYDRLSGIWSMVARTAFCQLHYSAALLAGATAGMLIVFCLPVAGFFFPVAGAKIISAAALTAMILSYLPTLKFYGRSRWWAFTLPAIGLLYLAMTWSSVIRHWTGKGSSWKDRSYTGHPEG